ncbi:MAG: glucosamine-6-phosphate deaminase [Coriobacteriales bacterium]|jgi:glucosamine-6-phosphate deaminase|nr:glucosamine-6-phosphate deaminase [Coriobacteriales bacterium]
MNIQVCKDTNSIGKAAATMFAAEIINNPRCVLGLATGSTPLPTYNALIELNDAGIVSFETVRSFNLDEYVGIPRSHEQSYYSFMFENLFSRVNIKPDNVQVPTPASTDLNDDCVAYDAAIDAAGGIDIQLLGIGHNGHIAFNEPTEVFPFGTHIVDLTESTIEANTRFFDCAEDVPKKAMTMGIGSIMKARSIVLIATGAGKAEAVKAMIKGEVDPQCPASVLQLHPNVTVFLDAEAASLL